MRPYNAAAVLGNNGAIMAYTDFNEADRDNINRTIIKLDRIEEKLTTLLERNNIEHRHFRVQLKLLYAIVGSILFAIAVTNPFSLPIFIKLLGNI